MKAVALAAALALLAPVAVDAKVKPRAKRDRIGPAAQAVAASGETIVVTFDEPLGPRVDPEQLLVVVDGVQAEVLAAVPRARTLTVSLLHGVARAQRVSVLVGAGAVRDRATNRSRPRTLEATAGGAPGCRPTLDGDRRYGVGTTRLPEFSLRSRGRVRALVVPLDFPDAPGDEDATALASALAGRIGEWFAGRSYGRLQLRVDAANAWTRMPAQSSSYGVVRGAPGSVFRPFYAAAFAAADAALDFRGVDVVYFVTPARAQVSWSAAWTENPGEGFRVDGGSVRHVTVLGADVRAEAGGGLEAIALGAIHESLHFLGLPDLYLFERVTWDSAAPVGGWDIMSIPTPGVSLFAWHRWKLGWLPPASVVCVESGAQEVALAPIEAADGVRAVVVPVNATSLYVVENRQRVGEDRNLCHPGVLVYRVDGLRPNGGGPISVVDAHPSEDSGEIARCRSHYAAALAPGRATRLDTPSLPFTIELLAADGETWRVRVTRR